MGMFDNVRCVYPLEGLPERDAWNWQTKSMPTPDGSTYAINNSGLLWHKEYNSAHWVRVADFEGRFEIHDVVSCGPRPWAAYSVEFWFRDGAIKDYIVHGPEEAADAAGGDS